MEEACRVPEPSGGTPERKRYPRPDKFSATRPVGKIMSDFRGKGKSPLHPPRNCLDAVPSDQGEALSSAAPTELLGDSSDEAGGGVEQDASCVSTASSALDPLVGGGVVEESAVIAEPKDALEETLSSLDYATKAKNIENTPETQKKPTKGNPATGSKPSVPSYILQNTR